MTHFKWFFTAVLAALILSACAVQPPTANTPQPTNPPASPVPPTLAAGNPLAGTAWKLVSFGPVGSEKQAIPGKDVTLTFDNQGQAGGNGGCNSYGGTYTVEQGKLQIGQVMRTLMACADKNITQQEDAYLAALETAGSFSINGDQLVITSADGATHLTFTRGG